MAIALVNGVPTQVASGIKFGRTYSLAIQVTDAPISSPGDRNDQNAVVIGYPITLYLDVKRNTLGSSNTASFRILNLSEKTRRRIFHDRNSTNIYRQIILSAGYESDPQLPIIFQGNILSAYSYRQKQDWVTEIEAFDGGFGLINGQVSLTVPSGYDFRSLLSNIIRTMPNVATGAIGDVAPAQDAARGTTVAGSSWEAVNSLAPDANAFIDNETAYVLNKNEYVVSDDDPFPITSETGLLETPRRFDLRLDAKILFEPRMKLGKLVILQSQESYYNGLYAVNGVCHSGVISGAISGDLVTTLSLWKGTSTLIGVNATQ